MEREFEKFLGTPATTRDGASHGVNGRAARKTGSTAPTENSVGVCAVPIDADLTSQERAHARKLLQGAAQVAQTAVDAERRGDDTVAIARWRSLLGDAFR